MDSLHAVENHQASIHVQKRATSAVCSLLGQALDLWEQTKLIGMQPFEQCGI